MAVKRLSKFLVYISLIVMVVFCAYLLRQNTKLKSELDGFETIRTGKNEDLEKYGQLQSGDSLLIKGQYQKAIKQYRKFSNDPELPVEFRLVAATRLREMERKIYNLQECEIQEDSVSVIPEQQKTPDQRTLDSLSFALEKSQRQLQNIKNQVRSRVYGEYITFKSKKGNRLHYVGEVKNKKANGYGIAILDSGSRYEGEWIDNQRHGKGVFYWIDGEHYEGDYKNDQRSGMGTYFWTTGEKFVGNWENDKRNGNGTFYGKDGNIITKGYWEDDQLIEKKDN